ncbi:MAG: Conserved inner membrane protein [Candidatus Tokpelaia hoelldobleri]|uniref:Conserved inner membrane protein n=1 Tax=Candidatus Tokpelaia hoelldobleri TaxID=1902579 RepID=A0A1U9JU81_9HYPH|nr:MAG: Conserved inner membrane protein [Candidatus Tokpelaia hoelldoblerii]
MKNFPRSILPDFASKSWWLGTLLVILIAVTSQYMSDLAVFSRLGLGALTLAIIIGMVAGNTFFPKIAARTAHGVDYAKGMLLRGGIILYGFRLTFQDIAQVGWTGIVIDAIMVAGTFALAVIIGHYILRMDRETTVLVGTGSAICGAAAGMGAEPVIRAQPHKVSVAVATVVIFGTLSLFLYPLLYPLAGLGEHAFGVYIGSTVHEVAQVAAAGSNISKTAANSAVIVKMIRVMMLVPFLLLLSVWLSRNDEPGNQGSKITIPWFAVLFIVAAGIASLHILPQTVLNAASQGSTLLLSMAMAALGLRTHWSAMRDAGIKPLILAACLFIFLVIGGGALNIVTFKLLTIST